MVNNLILHSAERRGIRSLFISLRMLSTLINLNLEGVDRLQLLKHEALVYYFLMKRLDNENMNVNVFKNTSQVAQSLINVIVRLRHL
jgi:hypothetical protein